ncbi:hypothetical protein GCM10010211_03570 [Streptomyces albospinus]|uniref:Uncharacterized protein n=1 Tax=Streptomyces albospinus TaxID=285515 RepID=A0ABQ2UN73_9ACTN|nr:hypothetical protein GCM10010211_03570 [Streptomyces albospinus]
MVHDVQTFGTISRGHDLEALQLKVDPDQLPDHLVVVHDKDPTGQARHTMRLGADLRLRPGFAHFRPHAGDLSTSTAGTPAPCGKDDLPSPPAPLPNPCS